MSEWVNEFGDLKMWKFEDVTVAGVIAKTI